jgi:DNA-directed RNA polymerase specialized sigma24 family protein
MCGTIRSISGDLWRDGKFKLEVPIAGSIGSDGQREIDPPDDSPNQEREVIARRTLERIFAVFAKDRNALAILRGLADGSSPEEIQRANDISPKQYASTQKRIRRRLSIAIEESEI